MRSLIVAVVVGLAACAPLPRGIGLKPDPDRDYRVEGLASWLGRFLDALQLDRVTLVAHSMGATIGLLYALEHPERIEKLVVSNPVVVGATAFSRRDRLCMKPGIRRLLYLLARIGPIRRWVSKNFTSVGPLEEDLAKDVIRGTYQSMFDSLLSGAKADLRGRLASLSVPTLSIGTDLDHLVAPEQYELVPAQQKVCIRECGHIPMIERPAEFNRVLNEFLSAPAHG